MKRVVIQPNTTTVKVYSVGLQGPPGSTGETGAAGSSDVDSLNTFSGSAETRLDDLEAATASYLVSSDTGSFVYSGSFDGSSTLTLYLPDGNLDLDLTALQGGSTDVTDLNIFTGSADTRLDNLEAATGSYRTNSDTGSLVYSGSFDGVSNLTLYLPDGNLDLDLSPLLGGSTDITSLNNFTSSAETRLDSLEAVTSSYLTEIPAGTVSSSAQIQAVVTDSYISASAAASGFGSGAGGSTDISDLNTFTGSASSRLDDLEAATSSYLTEVPSGTVSSSAQIQAVITDNYISASAAASGFGSGGGSSTDISDLNTFTGSASSRLDDLEAATSSFLASSDTGSLLVTASVASNVITLEKADGTSFDLTVETGSGGGVASNANRSGALFDNIPVNELINDTWTFNTTNRKILPNTSGKFTTSTNQITIAASSSAGNYYYTELSASKAGDGLVISDNTDKMRYTINSFSIVNNAFENFATSSIGGNYQAGQLQTNPLPNVVDLPGINKVLVLSGSSYVGADDVYHFTSSNVTTPGELVNSAYDNKSIIRATYVSGGFFASGQSGGDNMRLRGSDGNADDNWVSGVSFFMPFATGTSGSGEYLLFASKFNNSPNAHADIIKIDTTSNPAQFDSRVVNQWNGYTGMVYNNGSNVALQASLDGLWDESTKSFYHLLWSGDRNYPTMSIAELTSSLADIGSPKTDAPFKTGWVQFSDPRHGLNIPPLSSVAAPFSGKTIAGPSNSKLWIYNRGDGGKNYTSSIIEFDYSSGISSGVYSEVISLSQTSNGDSTWGYATGSLQYSYWVFGGLIYSPTNDVLVAGAYNVDEDAPVTYVYDASSYTLLQTIDDVMLTGESTITETGTIVTYDPDGTVKVLTPSSGDSEKFVYSVSYYDNDPSVNIVADSGDTIYTKLQLKDPVATSPNGNKWRLTIDNNGVVTGSAI